MLCIPDVDISFYSPEEQHFNNIYKEITEYHFSNITRKTIIENIFPLVAVDVETTGLNTSNCEIIEVSAIKYEKDFKPTSCLTTLCKPSKPISEKTTSINHITNEMVADAHPFIEVLPFLSNYIEGCNIVGHNLEFDLDFLQKNGLRINPKVKLYDTLQLAKYTLISSTKKVWDKETKSYTTTDDWDVYDYKLETLCNHYDIYRDDAHRSLSDCFATVKVMENLIDDKIGN